MGICAGALVVVAAWVTGVSRIGSGEVVGAGALLLSAGLLAAEVAGELLIATGVVVPDVVGGSLIATGVVVLEVIGELSATTKVLVLDVIGEFSAAGVLTVAEGVARSFAAEMIAVLEEEAVTLSVAVGNELVKAAVVGTGETPGCTDEVARVNLPFTFAAADVVVASVEKPVPRLKAKGGS